jgi:L-asparagine transporter-like permease
MIQNASAAGGARWELTNATRMMMVTVTVTVMVMLAVMMLMLPAIMPTFERPLLQLVTQLRWLNQLMTYLELLMSMMQQQQQQQQQQRRQHTPELSFKQP